jgi:hypothetical protein
MTPGMFFTASSILAAQFAQSTSHLNFFFIIVSPRIIFLDTLNVP